MEDWKGTTAFVAVGWITTYLRYTKKPVLWLTGDKYTKRTKREKLARDYDAKGVKDKQWLTEDKSLLRWQDVPATNESLVLWRINSVISRVPTLFKTYYPSFYWLGNFQLIPFMINSIYSKPESRRQHPWAYENASLQDGEKVRIAYAGEKEVPSSTKDNVVILILHHGAGGRESDLPGTQYVGRALEQGWKVISFVRRGHVGRLTKPKFNFFGSTEETRFLIDEYVKQKYPNSTIFFLGVSAGSGLTARYMGEQGCLLKKAYDSEKGNKMGLEYVDFKDRIPAYVAGAIGISPGFNIEVCMSRFVEPFMSILLWAAKKLYHGKNEKLLKEAYPEDQQKCLKAKNFQEWNDLTYRFAGFPSRNSYYDHTNPMRTVHHAVDPCLFINAQDDPICPIENLYEHLNLFDEAHCLAVAETATGTHCPFLPLSWNPFTNKAWTEDVVIEFFTAVMAVERERKEKLSNATDDDNPLPDPRRLGLRG